MLDVSGVLASVQQLVLEKRYAFINVVVYYNFY